MPLSSSSPGGKLDAARRHTRHRPPHAFSAYSATSTLYSSPTITTTYSFTIILTLLINLILRVFHVSNYILISQITQGFCSFLGFPPKLPIHKTPIRSQTFQHINSVQQLYHVYIITDNHRTSAIDYIHPKQH